MKEAKNHTKKLTFHFNVNIKIYMGGPQRVVHISNWELVYRKQIVFQRVYIFV